jgi:hypothetical protein
MDLDEDIIPNAVAITGLSRRAFYNGHYSEIQ